VRSTPRTLWSGACRQTLFVTVPLAAAIFLATTSSHAQEPRQTPTVKDAIAMSRIHHLVTSAGTVGAFSPDGKRFATVVWRGDLTRNVNVFSLLVFDLTPDKVARAPPRAVLTWDFAGDLVSQDSSAFEQLTFLADNRTIAFLGRKGNAPRQVYSVHMDTGKVRALTNHPNEVKSFAIAADGSARIFSSVVDADEHRARLKRVDEDGVFLWDSTLFAPSELFKARPALDPQPRWARQYFLQDSRRSTPIFDSRQSRPKTLSRSQRELDRGFDQQLYDEETLRRLSSLTADRQGRYALLFPYARADEPIDTSHYEYYRSADGNPNAPRYAPGGKLDAPYALIDLATGRMQKFIDAPRPYSGKGSGNPVWAPDGRSVAIFTLLPPGTHEGSADEPPQWAQVDIATREVTPLNVPRGWQVSSWSADGSELVLYDKYMGFATMSRDANGQWGDFKRHDAARHINPIWKPATSGRFVVGVKDSTYSPPELVALDLSTGVTTVLTDLNPELRQRRHGEVEVFRWTHRYDPEASGFLVKPVGFEPSRRYPLVVLLDDATLKGTVDPYLLDAAFQLSGHAIQMLAADGFMVLYTREPRLLFDDSDGSDEGERMTVHVESAIDQLERQGLIDTKRMGISGWSRAAWHTDVLLISSSRRFAAATQVDGGSRQYVPRMRPFTDEELKRMRTPLLFEPHGLLSLVSEMQMAERLEAFGKPTEVLYFATASHSTTRPQHRLRSLQTHLDWWRFWLKDHEDSDPEKAAQYRRWRAMRATWEGAQKR
jgi:dipeptidyl aminopeptidase/acylaminoacyl peptidase